MKEGPRRPELRSGRAAGCENNSLGQYATSPRLESQELSSRVVRVPYPTLDDRAARAVAAILRHDDIPICIGCGEFTVGGRALILRTNAQGEFAGIVCRRCSPQRDGELIAAFGRALAAGAPTTDPRTSPPDDGDRLILRISPRGTKSLAAAEATRAIARLTHRLVRRRRRGAAIRAAILAEAERRGIAAERAVAIGAGILREKIRGHRHA